MYWNPFLNIIKQSFHLPVCAGSTWLYWNPFSNIIKQSFHLHVCARSTWMYWNLFLKHTFLLPVCARSTWQTAVRPRGIHSHCTEHLVLLTGMSGGLLPTSHSGQVGSHYAQ